MGQIVKRFFNIFNPPPIVVDWVEAYIPIMSLYPPRISHEVALVDLHGALTIHLNNLLPFLLLLIYSWLLPLIFMGNRIQRILRRMNSFLTYPDTLAKEGSWLSGCRNNWMGWMSKLKNGWTSKLKSGWTWLTGGLRTRSLRSPFPLNSV